MPEQLWLTALLNKYLAGPANALLGVFHVHAAYPQAPFTNYVAMQLLVFVLLVLMFIAVRARLSVDNPGALQHMMEGINSFVNAAEPRSHWPRLRAVCRISDDAWIVHPGRLPDRADSWI